LKQDDKVKISDDVNPNFHGIVLEFEGPSPRNQEILKNADHIVVQDKEQVIEVTDGVRKMYEDENQEQSRATSTASSATVATVMIIDCPMSQYARFKKMYNLVEERVFSSEGKFW